MTRNLIFFTFLLISILLQGCKPGIIKDAIQGEWKYTQKYKNCLSQVERYMIRENGYPESEWGEIWFDQEMYRRCDNHIPESERKIIIRKGIFD